MAAAAIGGVLGFVMMLPGHVLGGTGAGDVKLVAALGTLLGPAGVFMAVLYGAVAGGVLAAGTCAPSPPPGNNALPHRAARRRAGGREERD